LVCCGRTGPRRAAIFIRIVLAGALVLAAMVAIKDGRILRTAGLTASCSVVQRTAEGVELDACRPGKLEGRPDLSRRGCTNAGLSGTYEYWRCPAPTASAPLP
jgi:hypothetical protein